LRRSALDEVHAILAPEDGGLPVVVHDDEASVPKIGERGESVIDGSVQWSLLKSKAVHPIILEPMPVS
jgi:hypothetical protein